MDSADFKQWAGSAQEWAKEFVLASLEVLDEYRVRGLRDEFAKAALTGILASADDICGECTKDHAMGAAEWAKDAYEYADAMLAARNVSGVARPTDRDPDDCAPCLDHGQSPDRGEGPVDK